MSAGHKDKVKKIKTRWQSFSDKWSKLSDPIKERRDPFFKGDLISFVASGRLGIVQLYEPTTGKSQVWMVDNGEVIKARSFEIELVQRPLTNP
jgi:hypothetical protein